MALSIWTKLLVSLLIDAVGLLNYLVPGFGEAVDIAWAPVSAFLVQRLYHMPLFSVLGFAEEALPFTDFIPTATIAWLYERYNERGHVRPHFT